MKRRLGALGILESIENTLLSRLERIRATRQTGVAWIEADNHTFQAFLHRHSNPSLVEIGNWLIGPSRIKNLDANITSALGIPPSMINFLFTAGYVQKSFKIPFNQPHELINAAKNAGDKIILITNSDSTIDIDVPITTLDWLAWLSKCLIERKLSPLRSL